MEITMAVPADIPAMVNLMNSAYRGESSKKGWTTEADMVEGSLRTDAKHLQGLMNDPTVCFLKCLDEDGELEGCVFLQKRANKLYLGMLSVDPGKQTRGAGKKLMQAAEDYARKQDCISVIMRVISIRNELIAWYERQGYAKTGVVEPFEDSIYGTAKQPIEFQVMEKMLDN
jgi:ribosomal protein S18 acetylase RimI-like enzyme